MKRSIVEHPCRFLRILDAQTRMNLLASVPGLVSIARSARMEKRTICSRKWKIIFLGLWALFGQNRWKNNQLRNIEKYLNNTRYFTHTFWTFYSIVQPFLDLNPAEIHGEAEISYIGSVTYAFQYYLTSLYFVHIL